MAGHGEVIELARAHGIDVNGEDLVIKRAISAARNRVYVNGTLSTVAVLALLGAKLVEIHGQYEQQTLLHPEHQLDIFDSYAGVLELRYALERQYYYLQGLRKRLAELTAQADERAVGNNSCNSNSRKSIRPNCDRVKRKSSRASATS